MPEKKERFFGGEKIVFMEEGKIREKRKDLYQKATVLARSENERFIVSRISIRTRTPVLSMGQRERKEALFLNIEEMFEARWRGLPEKKKDLFICMEIHEGPGPEIDRGREGRSLLQILEEVR